MKTVSVIICNLNGKTFLPRLLHSVRAQRGVETQIIVVDRESTDGSLDYLASAGDVTVVSEPAVTGLVAGYQAAVGAARHDVLFFCNEDLWLDEECLARLVSRVSIRDRIGAADPWQWSYDGRRLIRSGTRFVKAFLDPINCYPPRRVDFLVPLPGGALVPFGCGGAVLIHRRMYEETGGWDPSFFLEFEDVDFFLRAWQRGWRCVVEPDAKVYHAVGMSTYQAGPAPSEVLWRRHVAGESNRAVICLKSYTGASLGWAAVLLLRPMVAHAVHLRFRSAWAYVQASRLTMSRLPAVGRFRQKNRPLARTRPGQHFFTAPEFQRPR